jgi:hypothetical protein
MEFGQAQRGRQIMKLELSTSTNSGEAWAPGRQPGCRENNADEFR